ncbi:FtsK/SpoIIIE domain-containing protein [Paenibacillus pasadenensis]|uniref:FtsK/SpoIIIE domain-containing protein n=1 Tax=Paenibacillus pasadenensis TaxID=217090 RepID=UPI0004907D3E|nr:FtsK/SpoIIIE domain-containing protein [Paenibacillus pasadenensis]
MALRYHVSKKLRWPGVRYRLLAHQDHRLMYFEDQTLMGEILEVLERPWYRRMLRWPWFAWEIEANDVEIGYYYWAPNEQVGDEIRRKIVGKHPDVHIEMQKMAPLEWRSDGFVSASSLQLERDYPVPIKSFFNEVVDTQAPIVNAVSDLEEHERCLIQVLVQPARRYQRDFDKALRIVKRWDKEDEYEKIELFETNIAGKQNKQLGHCVVRIMTTAKTAHAANRIRNEVARSFGQFTSEALNSFKPREKWMHIKPLLLKQIRLRIFPIRERRLRRMILNIEELSGLIRMPSSEVNNSRLTRLFLKQLEAPAGIVKTAIEARNEGQAHRFLRFGENEFRMRKTNVVIDTNNLNRHLAVLGGSGVGKTVFLVQLVMQLIDLKRQGNPVGFFLIDPLGGLASEVMSNIPRSMWDQVNYVRPDPHAKEHFPLNLFDVDFSSTEHSVAHNIAEAIGRIWPEGWGPRPAQNFLMLGMALQRLGEANILNLDRCLWDASYALGVMSRLRERDPELANKGVDNFLMKLVVGGMPKASAVDKRTRADLVDSTLNKLVHFRMSSVLAPAMGATSCGFRWKESMDKGLINILDLSRVQDDSEKRMLGSLALTMNYQASQARDSTANNLLYPLIVDEFPMFIEANAKVINEMADRTRQKFVPIIGAAQGIITQLDQEVADAIGRNFNSQVIFRLNHMDDCEWMEKQLNDPRLKATDIMRIPPSHAYARLALDREMSAAFTLNVLKPTSKAPKKDTLDEIVQLTIQRANDREQVRTEEIAAVAKQEEEITMDFSDVMKEMGRNTDTDSDSKVPVSSEDPGASENDADEGDGLTEDEQRPTGEEEVKANPVTDSTEAESNLEADGSSKDGGTSAESIPAAAGEAKQRPGLVDLSDLDLGFTLNKDAFGDTPAEQPASTVERQSADGKVLQEGGRRKRNGWNL